ncbi:MAG: hypothetical protein LBI63_04295 [Candidatus Ancillula sp.]|jgi:hypothetical protein|nr:hypothetical protein [Candidatus Ancillula sp.]
MSLNAQTHDKANKKAKNKDDLLVLTVAKELLERVLDYTSKSPKSVRYVFSTRLQNLALDILTHVFDANEIHYSLDENKYKYRYEMQIKAHRNIRLLILLVDIAQKADALTSTQVKNISTYAVRLNKLLIAWIKSDLKREEENAKKE